MITDALIVSAILFTIGVVGVLTRRNAIILFMCVELMLNAVNLSFVALAKLHGATGQVFVIMVMTVAAAEAAVGLAIVISVFRPLRYREHVGTSAASRMTFALLQESSLTRAGHPLAGSVAELIWLVPLLPLLGAVLNGAISVLPGAERRKPLVMAIGVGVIAAAFAMAATIFVTMLGASGLETPLIRTYAHWMASGAMVVDWGIQLDQLSILMTLIITGIGALIHLFSVGYMASDASFARYFAYLNLFVACMLTLVLGSSYPVLFVGWEGVGLCSYLLIGFWFSDKANVDAGKKAFVVNRIGDFGFLVAIFMIWTATGRLDFVGAHTALAAMAGSATVLAIALFLFLGCAGKSAQLPLYVWLPDAMAGPTPVSALIHAATMVTAGVYLVARASVVFAGAPAASLLVALVGALTALFAATIALRQWDIKKVLAYSTVSQLGYMFMGVGTGAYTAGVFHLVTHAFFKAVLFLGAGSVIHALHHAYSATGRHEDAQDLRNMGGLGRFLPITAAAMALAVLAIAGIPPLSGFFSKDEILTAVYARAQGSALASGSLLGVPGSAILTAVYVIGLITALLTAVYMTRMMVLAFTGANRTGDGERAALHESPVSMTAPIVVLAVLATIGGWINLPALIPLGPVGRLEHWLDPVVGRATATLAPTAALSHSTEYVLVGVAIALAVVGIAYAAVRYRTQTADKAHATPDTGLAGALASAYHIDRALDIVVVRPVNAIADRVLARGVDRGVDSTFSAGGRALARLASAIGARFQDGDVGKYAWLLAAGALVVISAVTLRIS